MKTKKADKTAAADSTQDILKDAIKLYEDALKNGIELQEESLKLWKDMLVQVGTPDELMEKIEKMTGGVFPEAREKMNEALKLFQDNANQSVDLFKKTMDVCNADSWEEGKTRSQSLMESSLKVMRTNVQTVLDANTKMMDSWTDLVEKTSAKTF
jgi:hypothetical protein